MRLLNLLPILIVSLLTFSCATVPTADINITADIAPQTNLGQYRSYGWLLAAAALNDPDGLWEPPGFDTGAEIEYLVNRELRGRGLEETSRNPDLVIGYGIGLDMAALELRDDAGQNLAVLENIPQGGLVLVIVDNKTAEVFWAGLATADKLDKVDDAARRERLDYTISRMIKTIP